MAGNGKAVAVKPGNSVAVADAALAEAYGEFLGQGFENTTREDFAMPFLAILQAISPQVEDLDGAKAGMIINTVTNELFDGKGGIEFVPAVTEHVYVEWKPRAAGGGFVAVHKLDSDEVKRCRAEQEFGKFKVNGNDLIETYYVYGNLVRPDGSYEPYAVAFSSTKIKSYKSFTGKANTVQVVNPNTGRRVPVPIFAHKFKFTTVKEKNNKGEYYNWSITWSNGTAGESRLAPSEEVFQASVVLKDTVLEGAQKVAYGTQDAAGSEGGEGKSGDIPF